MTCKEDVITLTKQLETLEKQKLELTVTEALYSELLRDKFIFGLLPVSWVKPQIAASLYNFCHTGTVSGGSATVYTMPDDTPICGVLPNLYFAAPASPASSILVTSPVTTVPPSAVDSFTVSGTKLTRAHGNGSGGTLGKDLNGAGRVYALLYNVRVGGLAAPTITTTYTRNTMDVTSAQTNDCVFPPVVSTAAFAGGSITVTTLAGAMTYGSAVVGDLYIATVDTGHGSLTGAGRLEVAGQSSCKINATAGTLTKEVNLSFVRG